MIKCDYCGRENPDDAFHCSGCASELREEPPVVKQTKAGFWIRAAARVLDMILLFLLAIFTGTVAGIFLSLASSIGWISHDWQSLIGRNFLLSILFGSLADIAYHTACEGIHGATVGKLCCGICVVHENGKPNSLLAAFVRNLAYLLDAQFFGAVAYSSMKKSPLNQRYGDRWAKTAVLRSSEIASDSKRSSERLFLAIGSGLVVHAMLVATGLLLQIF